MDDFLVKPFDEQQMVEMLGRWLTPRDATTSPTTAKTADEASLASMADSIDPEAIAKIRAIGGERASSLLRRVVSQFEATSTPLVAAIREKCEESDPESVWRSAHSLKSSAAAIGAVAIAARCAEIEVQAREHGTLPPMASVAMLEQELAAANQELRRLVASDLGVAAGTEG
jgi:HPt (histidine-containing phosphotransfer) domain-containing protein